MQPLEQLIDTITKNKNAPANFEDLKNELTRLHSDGTSVYRISLKEDDYLCLIFHNDGNSYTEKQENKPEAGVIELEQSCRSVIIEKETMKPIVSQNSRIIYNAEATEYLKDKPWDQMEIYPCFEGTQIVVFNHHDQWYVSTRRCLNADDSNWIKNKSYREMFNEAIEGKFSLEELDKNLCYHFVLIHHKNRNIVSYDYLGSEYKEILQTFVSEKYTLKEVNFTINSKVKKQEKTNFESLEHLLNKIAVIDEKDRNDKHISTEGFIVRFYHGEVHNSPFTTIKLQTPIYQTLQKMRPNNSNIHQAYLELYQHDKLAEFLTYFGTRHRNDIVKRVHTSMRTIAKEVLDLYHMTRQKRHPELYQILPDTYKKILYALHGLYIQHRKKEFKEESPDIESNSRSINVHDVYHYIKHLPFTETRQLFYERSLLISKDQNNEFSFLNKGCINTLSQQTLMFGTPKSTK